MNQNAKWCGFSTLFDVWRFHNRFDIRPIALESLVVQCAGCTYEWPLDNMSPGWKWHLAHTIERKSVVCRLGLLKMTVVSSRVLASNCQKLEWPLNIKNDRKKRDDGRVSVTSKVCKWFHSPLSLQHPRRTFDFWLEHIISTTGGNCYVASLVILWAMLDHSMLLSFQMLLWMHGMVIGLGKSFS